MNKETFVATMLKKNLEDSRPGKKPFPERNWHYLSNLSRAHDVTALPYGVPAPLRHQLQQSSTQGEIESLRRQLQQKSERVNQLRYQLSATRGQDNHEFDRSPYISRSIDRRSKHVYQPLASHSPSEYAPKYYYTRKAAKPLGEDPITGLTRTGSSYHSPLRTTGAALARHQLRPNFN